MKTLAHLGLGDNQKSLAILIQVLDESLFDHTVDSFKAPALSVHSLALEFLHLAERAKSGVVREGALRPVREEFLLVLKNDLILKPRINELRPLIQVLQSAAASVDRQIRSVHIIDTFLEKNYWRSLIDRLTAAVDEEVPSGDLVQLAHSLIAESEVIGFSRAHLYHEIQVRFFMDELSSDYDARSSFLKLMADLRLMDDKKYSVIFRANKAFSELRRLDGYGKRGVFGVKIINKLKNIPDGLRPNTGFMSHNTKYPLFLMVSDVEGLDRERARIYANGLISGLVDLVALANRKSKPRWSGNCAVIELESNKAAVIEEPAPRTRLRNEPAFGLGISLDELISFVMERHAADDGMSRVINALEQHRVALESRMPQTQLVALWAAIEGLATPLGDKDRVTQYVDCLLPILTLTYPEKLFGAILSAIERNHPELHDLLNEVTIGQSSLERLVAVLILKDDHHAGIKAKFFSRLGHDPLLRYRCFRVGQQFSDRKIIAKTLEDHRRRVGWHIQRIYSTRNQIVHEGRPLPYISTLVENLHSYLDTVVRSLVRTATMCSYRMDLDSIFEMLLAQCSAWEMFLLENKCDVTNENIFSMVFGPINSVGPRRDSMLI